MNNIVWSPSLYTGYENLLELSSDPGEMMDSFNQVANVVAQTFNFQFVYVAQFFWEEGLILGLSIYPENAEIYADLLTEITGIRFTKRNIRKAALPYKPGSHELIDRVLLGEQMEGENVVEDFLGGLISQESIENLNKMLGVNEWICLPLRVGDEIEGFILAASKESITVENQRVELINYDRLLGVMLQNARLHTIIQDQLEARTILHEASMVIASTLDLQQVLFILAEQMVRALDVTSSYICTFDRRNSTSKVIADFYSPESSEKEKISDLGNTYSQDQGSDFLVTTDPDQYHADDPRVSEKEREHLKEFDCKSVFIFPLKIRGEITAFVELWESRRPREFTPKELALGQAIAQHAAIAIENASLYDEIESRLIEQTAIKNAISVISSSLDLDEILTCLAEQICFALDATSTYVCKYDLETNVSTVIAEYITPKASNGEKISGLGASYIESDAEFLKTLSKGEPLVRQHDDPALCKVERDLMSKDQVHSILFIPLNRQERALGYIEVNESRWRREFTPDEINLCQTLAQQTLVAIEKSQLFNQAQLEIVEHKKTQERLKRSEREYRGLFENAHDAILIFDPESEIVLDVNQRACEIYGFSRDEFTAISLADITENVPRGKEYIKKTLKKGVFFNFETVHIRSDGTKMNLEINASVVDFKGKRAILSVNRDVTARSRAEAQLMFDALHDELTGLPNRSLFMDRLESALTRTERRGQSFAVLFIDLDNFKYVNDRWGHNFGDKLLKSAAIRFRECLRETDTVARLGGDEFVILMDDIQKTHDVTYACERIQSNLSIPFKIEAREVVTSASIGVVLSNQRYKKSVEYLRDADIAMYRAKDKGKARYEIFDQEMRQQIMTRLRLESDLRRALDRNEFMLHYQPIMEINQNHLIGLEAFLRWQHPEHGLLFPGEFIQVAEEIGIIYSLGGWALKEACSQICSWQAKFSSLNPLQLTINLSSQQISRTDVITLVAETLKETGLPASSLRLDVLESAFINDVSSFMTTLVGLKTLGVSLCLDGFGTGYSSLSHIQEFPIDAIKIDRTFLRGLTATPADVGLVRIFLSLANELGLEAIAEGIETKEQLELLVENGCSYGQGYYFSEPMKSEAVPEFLRRM